MVWSTPRSTQPDGGAMVQRQRISLEWQRVHEGPPQGRVRCEDREHDFAGWYGLLVALSEVAHDHEELARMHETGAEVDADADHRDTEGAFYGDLAPWWPLISPVDDYEEEAAFVHELLAAHDRPVRQVLELGSGGGHNAAFLKASYELTLTDLSVPMLTQSRQLNPECEHVHGDMRRLRLDRSFDAVFVHDAIEYMTTEDDLRAALTTAYAHLRPGGIAVVLPDATSETFTPSEEVGGTDGEGRSVRYLEWTFDPDPSDDTVQTEYVFALRQADRVVRTVHETHVTGLFARDTWLRLLTEVGFDARRIVEPTTEDRTGRDVFLAVRPG
jgi:SAM-dependent methyltransferase